MDSFQQRKKDVLKKLDKSSKGSWDERILGLCEKINSFNNYYTTSSCSGRILILKDDVKKGPGLYKFVSHDLVKFDEFWEFILKKKSKLNLKFKQEPFILHIACKDLESAKILLEKSLRVGIKRSGIISLGKNIIVELNSTKKLEFPLIKDGTLLVRRDFLKIVLDEANDNFKKEWFKIKELEGFL